MKFIKYLPVTVSFKIFIYMFKSSTELYRQRLLKLNYFLLLSSVIGTVFCAMSFIGFSIGISEDLILHFCRGVIKVKKLQLVIFKRKNQEYLLWKYV